MGAIRRDSRYGLRLLARSPVFAIVAILSLALAIGASSAIFTLLNALVLRNLPAPHADRLAGVSLRSRDGRESPVSMPIFREIERHQHVFSGLFGWWGNGTFNVEANGELSPADLWAVTGTFYAELGAKAFVGRLLTPGDVNLNGGAPEQIAVLGYGFWQRRFASDPAVLGKTVRVEGVPFTVIGVMRKGFTGMTVAEEPDVTIPLTAAPAITKHLDDPGVFWISLVGRLKDGITLAQARADLESLWPGVRAAAIPSSYPTEERENYLSGGIEVKSIARGVEWTLRARFARPLCFLLAMTGMILVLVCVNLASLLLARASARGHEMSIRVAMGANRWHLLRQVLTESFLLAAGGSILGFVLACVGSRALVNFMMQTYLVPPALNLTPDLRVFGFVLAVAALTAILSGLVPAWRAAGQDLAGLLQQDARGMGRGTARVGKFLVATQVALSFVLLMGAGLFVRSLGKLCAEKSGIRTDRVLVAQLYPVPGGYENINNETYYPELVRRVSGLPAVRSAAWSKGRPHWDFGWKESVSDGSATAPSYAPQIRIGIISPGFFETLGMNILEGRRLEWSDDQHTRRVAIVSRSLARHLFPHDSAVGRHIRVGREPVWRKVEIVGVVSDARIFGAREPDLRAVYLPILQQASDYAHWGALEVHTVDDPANLAAAVRREITSLGREYPLGIGTLSSLDDGALLTERILAILSGLAGGLALLLTAIGLYGLMSYTITRRTREIGIRIALGAPPNQVLRMVMWEALALILVGVAVGMPAALAAARMVASLLFEISAKDPTTLVFAALVLLSVGALAAIVPARSASRVEPIVALRNE